MEVVGNVYDAWWAIVTKLALSQQSFLSGSGANSRDSVHNVSTDVISCGERCFPHVRDSRSFSQYYPRSIELTLSGLMH